MEFDVDWSLEYATLMHAKWFRLYAGVRRYHRKVIAKAREEGYVWVHYAGQRFSRRPVFDIGSSRPRERASAERIVMNTGIQGGAAIYMLRSLIAIYRAAELGTLPGVVAVVGTVHDSIWLVVVQDMLEQAFLSAARIMVSWETARDVPLEVDGKAGPSLGDLEKCGSLNSMDLHKLKIPGERSLFQVR